MKRMIKKYLRRFPIIKQFLARMENLANSLNAQQAALDAEIKEVCSKLSNYNNKLDKVKEAYDNKLSELETLKKEFMAVKSSLKTAYLSLEDLKKKQGQLKTSIFDIDRDLNKALNRQSSENIFFRNEFRVVKNDINYKYYKGLHPDSYEENIKEWFHYHTGEELDLKNPKTYNQKMQWLKLYDTNSLKTKLADKYAVREWVSEKIGNEYLIPLLGVWEKFEDIEFDSLPEKFVLKANHGSGYNIVVKDKNKLDLVLAERKLRTWLNTNFAFVNGFEMQYKDIKPVIICEKYMDDMDTLNDYKFMCFDGKVAFIWVDVERFKEHKRVVFTPEWKRVDLQITFPVAEYEIQKPKGIEEMIRIAEILSEGFCHVRVDLYNLKGKIYFGEMTFTSESGRCKFYPEEYNLKIGELMKLPIENND